MLEFCQLLHAQLKNCSNLIQSKESPLTFLFTAHLTRAEATSRLLK